MDRKNDNAIKEIPVVAYCSPNPTCVWNGRKFESQITAEYFDYLKDVGVTLVYGHDASEFDTEEEVIRSFELAQERGMGYLLRHEIFEEFWSIGRKSPAFSTLTVEQKEDLATRFLAVLKRYEKYSSFAGVAFRDEPGAEMFEGIAFAKEIFKKAYPDKIFHVNLFQFWVTGLQYQYSDAPEGESLPVSKRYSAEPKEARFTNYVNDYLDIVKPEFFSYDLYPMITLNGCETNIHIALYEQFCLCRKILDERGEDMPIYPFIQAGGKWEGSLLTRVPTCAEIALQIHSLLALGAKGLQIFPFCFPHCWEGDQDVVAGLIDNDGQKTDFYYYFKRAIRQAKACQTLFSEGKNVGYITYGDFVGLMPSAEEIAAMPGGECMFQGTFESAYQRKEFEPIKEVDTTSQLLIGCFEYDEKKAMYIVNNSITTSLNADISLREKKEFDLICDGDCKRMCADIIKIRNLQAGEAICYIEK